MKKHTGKCRVGVIFREDWKDKTSALYVRNEPLSQPPIMTRRDFIKVEIRPSKPQEEGK